MQAKDEKQLRDKRDDLERRITVYFMKQSNVQIILLIK